MNLKKLATAISYVTSISWITEHDQTDENLLDGLAKYLPYAGLVIGGILAAIAYALLKTAHSSEHLLPACVLTISWLLLTNGLHMDGLMDTADGIYSHQSRKRMLTIMQDSRVGNFGVLAGLSIILLKLTALACIAKHPFILISILVLVPVTSRWCELFAIGIFSYAKEDGKGKIWHDSTRMPNDLIFGMVPVIILTGLLAFYTNPQIIILSLATNLLFGIGAAYKLNSKIGGHTGDTYGATVEIAEAGALAATALLLPTLA